MTSVAGQIKSGNGGPCAPEIAFQEDTYVWCSWVQGSSLSTLTMVCCLPAMLRCRFILRGDADGEWFSPSFVWHAFRYAAVYRSNAGVVVQSVRAVQLAMDFDRVSTFTSSSEVGDDLRNAGCRD